MAYDDTEILGILDGQSPGYLIHPNASAFIAAGYDDAAEVEASLVRLAAAGHAEELEDVQHEPEWEPVLVPETDADGQPILDKKGNPKRMVPHLDVHGEPSMSFKLDADGKIVTKPKLDDDGNEIIINHGFEITAKGRKAAPPKPDLEAED